MTTNEEKKSMLNVVLVEPEIPQNTGNIIRTVAATDSRLHLVKPLGFDVSDRSLKRAGLDYWSFADFIIYESLDDFFQSVAKERAVLTKNTYCVQDVEEAPSFYFCSTKAARTYDSVNFKEGDYLIFGKETKGLPEDLLAENYDNTIRIPMKSGIRSLNLSNSVAIVLYEALRQNSFANLAHGGHLTIR